MKDVLTSWQKMLAAARSRANLKTERVPLWRVAGWGLKLIGRAGVVPFPELVHRGLFVEEQRVLDALMNAQLTIWPEGTGSGPSDRPEVLPVRDLIHAGRIHTLEVESVARVGGGFFEILGAIVSRVSKSADGGREAKFGWDQPYLQTLPDDSEQPGIIGLVVDLSGDEPLFLVEGRFEACRDDAPANVVLNATYATSWSNLNGEHGLPGDHMVRRLHSLPALFSAPGGGDGGRERKLNSLTVHRWDPEAGIELPNDRYAWMSWLDLLRAQGESLTSPHLDGMLGRAAAHLMTAARFAPKGSEPQDEVSGD